MNEPSNEQQIIIDYVKNKTNVIVDACAGSGKSTTVLSMAKSLPRRKFLQVTYNSMLRHEVNQKTKSLKIKNIKVHTYHSLAVRYYFNSAYTDSGIRKILSNSIKPREELEHIDVLVIDEAQDMTYLYFELVIKFLRDLNKKVQLVILGDYKQGLYEFKGSDTRFLTKSDEIWKNAPFLKYKKFVKTSLKMSYRITNHIKSFVNEVMLNENRMESCKNGEPVAYIKRPLIQCQKIIVHNILDLLEKGAKPAEIFILAGSVKGSNSKIRKIENALVQANIPCHIPMFEVDQSDERVTNGKVGIATFHSVKGRQRKYVFIIGFDNNYFDYYARTIPREICPNTLYVAATRPTDRLWVFESDDFQEDRPLEFLTIGHYTMQEKEYMRFLGIPRSIFYLKPEQSTLTQISQKVTPTDLIKFIPEHTLDIITPILDDLFDTEQSVSEIFDIPSIIQTSQNLYEEVSDLNGICIPCMYFDYIINENNTSLKSNVLYDIIQEKIEKLDKKHYFIHNIIEEHLKPEFTNATDYLFASNIFKSLDEQLYFKLRQISKNDCTWLLDEDIDKFMLRLDNVIKSDFDNKEPLIENTFIHNSQEELHINIDKILSQHLPNTTRFRFTARADLITDTCVWELKCTTEISIDHLIQVVIYAWLWNLTNTEPKTFKVFNIKTGEILVLKPDFDKINTIVTEIIKGKYFHFEDKDDDIFIQECRSTFS